MPTTTTCQWCGTTFEGDAPTCPSCGAVVDVRARRTDSGWEELPPIPNMARLQFGRSRVQIEGSYVPVADFALDAADSIYFSHHTLLWKDDAVPLTKSKLGSAWKRVVGGMPVVMAQANGPGRIALSMDRPGETVAVPLPQGRAVDVQEHHFLAATEQVGYEYVSCPIWFTTQSGDDSETHYPLGRYLDRFHALEAHGLLLLHAGGNVFVRDLGPQDTVLIRPPALLYKDWSVNMQLHLESPNSRGVVWSSSYANRYVWLRLWGPGRVCVQSQFGHFHDPGTRISRSSPLTRQDW